MTDSYTESQREYWTQRPANVRKDETVEFYHPDFGYIRLVANLFNNKDFMVDGVMQTFTAAEMIVPSATDQGVDTTESGSIKFGRVGQRFRDALLRITPAGAIRHGIRVTLRAYREGVATPIYERVVFVRANGISIGAETVSVALSVDNPAILRNKTRFYDPTIWLGLQST